MGRRQGGGHHVGCGALVALKIRLLHHVVIQSQGYEFVVPTSGGGGGAEDRVVLKKGDGRVVNPWLSCIHLLVAVLVIEDGAVDDAYASIREVHDVHPAESII